MDEIFNTKNLRENIDNSGEFFDSKPLVSYERSRLATLALSSVALIEILPTNEIIRGSLFGVSELITRNPILGGLVLGSSTFTIEALGGYAAANLLNSGESRKIIEKANIKFSKLKSFHNKENSSLLSKAGISLLGGTVVGMVFENTKNPDLTYQNNRTYNIITSTWLGISTSVLGFMASEGIKNGISEPGNVAKVAGGLVVAGSLYKLTKNKIRNISKKRKKY